MQRAQSHHRSAREVLDLLNPRRTLGGDEDAGAQAISLFDLEPDVLTDRFGSQQDPGARLRSFAGVDSGHEDLDTAFGLIPFDGDDAAFDGSHRHRAVDAQGLRD
jgi:hypothetical protein